MWLHSSSEFQTCSKISFRGNSLDKLDHTFSTLPAVVTGSMCTQLWKQLWRFCSNDLTQNAKTRFHYACSLNSLHSRQISVEKTETHCALHVPQETLSQSWKTKFTVIWACHWLHFNSARIQKIVCVLKCTGGKCIATSHLEMNPGLLAWATSFWTTELRPSGNHQPSQYILYRCIPRRGGGKGGGLLI